MLFPPGQPVRVPIVAVTGDADSASVCQLLAHLLTSAGKSVGLSIGGSATIDGLRLSGTEAGNAVDILLHNPAVEVAVVEVDPRTAEEHGIPFEDCDVAVVLSHSGAATTAGQSMERHLLEHLDARGVALFDAGDPEVVALASRAQYDTMLFGMDPRAAAILEHVASGGRAVMLKRTSAGSAIVLSTDGRSRTIWSENKVPLAALREGKLTSKSLLAAIGAAIACEVPIKTIQHALPAFRSVALAQTSTTIPSPATTAVEPTPKPNHRSQLPHASDPTMPDLTIGMATYKDFDGVYFSLQALRLYQDVEGVDFLVVDNYGCDDTRRFVTSIGGRYVRATELVGTAAAKNVVFQEARGHAVLCCDSHVLFQPGVIGRLKRYHREHPESRDLLQGPLVYDDLNTTSTHFDPVWRGQMWGVWASDPRGADPDGEPFDIPMQGMGAFSCRTAAWPGFNPAFRGFGGEEGYIHEKVRQAGGRCLCLPWFRWTHRFGRPAGVPYPLSVRDKIRNYLIGFIELGLDLDPIFAHFAEFTTPGQLEQIYEEALHDGVSSPVALQGAPRSLADN